MRKPESVEQCADQPQYPDEQYLRQRLEALPQDVADLYRRMYDWEPFWDRFEVRAMLQFAYYDLEKFRQSTDELRLDLPALRRVTFGSIGLDSYTGGSIEGYPPTFRFGMRIEPAESELWEVPDGSKRPHSDEFVRLILSVDGLTVESRETGARHPHIEQLRDVLERDQEKAVAICRAMLDNYMDYRYDVLTHFEDVKESDAPPGKVITAPRPVYRAGGTYRVRRGGRIAHDTYEPFWYTQAMMNRKRPINGGFYVARPIEPQSPREE